MSQETVLNLLRLEQLMKAVGRQEKRVTWDEVIDFEEVDRWASASAAVEYEALDAALEVLNAQDPRKAQIVELRFFAGLSIEETAEALGVWSSSAVRKRAAPSSGRATVPRKERPWSPISTRGTWDPSPRISCRPAIFSCSRPTTARAAPCGAGPDSAHPSACAR